MIPSFPNQAACKAPYDDLYIYYIQGRVAAELLPQDATFIGNWEEEGFSFLFFTCSADAQVSALIQRRPELVLLDRFQMPYAQWLGEQIQPFRIGRFAVVPAWDQAASAAVAENEKILLDPGVVFGTGTHPTTQDCLEAMEGLCYKQNIETVLDLGTGTGLLAIAAGRLNCRRVLAVDINFLATQTARRNMALNGLLDKVLVVQGRAEDFMDRPTDLVISNIHYAVMKNLLDSASFLRHRWFILSGLLRSQARAVAQQLSKLPVTVLKTWERDGIWHTFFGKGVEVKLYN